MLVYENPPGTLTLWTGEPIGDIAHPANIEDLWTTEDLNAIGLHRVQPFVPTANFHVAGNRRFERIDGVVQELYDTIPYTPEELAEISRVEDLENDPDRLALLDQLRTATPAQISSYVDNNATNLAGARTLFKRILLILSLISRE